MKRIAIVGSGVSGLSAAWLLGQNKEKFHVTLYEKDKRLGGHTNTVSYKSKGVEVNVDTGFIVFNKLTYPNFLRFLEFIGVEYEKSDMSFSVSVEDGAFEWSGQNMQSLFAQRTNIWSPQFYLMLFDIVRFNATAKDILNLPQDHPHRRCTIGQFLDRNMYSWTFINHYLIPMTAAIWSSPAESTFNSFPAETLVRFMDNHGLLQVLQHPQWYTITNGSFNYIKQIVPLIDDLKLNTEVGKISRDSNGVVVGDLQGNEVRFDAVIIACHGDEILKILTDPSVEELNALRKIHFTRNRAVLHSDSHLMPRRKAAWASWNYLTATTSCESNDVKKDIMCLTYWMNKLQNIPAELHGEMFVTMNPLHEPKAKVAEFNYTHPFYNHDLIEAQKELKNMNNISKNTFFAGAWMNFGFHEDGFTSGIQAASLLGAECPFEIIDSACQKRDNDNSMFGWLQWLIIWAFRCFNLLLIVSKTMISREHNKIKLH